MAVLLLKYIFVILHIVTAAAWFGLALRVAGRARVTLSLDGPSARVVAEDNHRSVRLMNIFVLLTFVFALVAFFAGGGFAVYGPPYHTSMLLILILILVQFFIIRPASSKLLMAAESGTGLRDEATSYPKRLAMGVGIGHTLWLLLLVLMFWNRISVAA